MYQHHGVIHDKIVSNPYIPCLVRLYSPIYVLLALALDLILLDDGIRKKPMPPKLTCESCQ